MKAEDKIMTCRPAPFDTELFDRLMDSEGAEVLIATSKHNVQYLLGGYRCAFYSSMDALGLSRYLPVFVYVARDLDSTAYFGSAQERYDAEIAPFWPATTQTKSKGSVNAISIAAEYLKRKGLDARRILIERAFLPLDAAEELRRQLPNADFQDATVALESLRARKTKMELAKIKFASEAVVESMLAMVARHGAGSTKRQLVKTLREEQVARGLEFEYCLMTVGQSHNRAICDSRWEAGEILSIDSGGNYEGYIGDLCRMAILGEPDAELQDLLSEVDAIQQAARTCIKAGVTGTEIFACAQAVLAQSPHQHSIQFMAHGMGLIGHEAPRMTCTGPVPYSAPYAESPLDSNMVLSIETTLEHPRRGFIKLEDTVAVTESGFVAFGDEARSWNTKHLSI